ncbi:MAG TPA: cytochrome c3 family protein [Usitatibacter sp.]
MKLLIVQRTPRGGGRTAQTKKTVAAEWIRVGRNSSCEIHLPDPRIALEQGMIVNRSGLVYIEGEAGSQDITRKSVRSVRMKPGEPLDIGPYRLEALPAPEGYDGAVAVELARPLEIAPDLRSRTERKTLASLGLSKRSAAWAGALAILVLYFLIPAARVLDLPWRQEAANAPIGDRAWNPGHVILAHQPIENQCSACHEVAFQHVKNGACLECHAKVASHVAPDTKPAALFAGTRCTSCHTEHKGVKTTHRDDDKFCVDCHRDIGAKAPGAGSMNVADFAAAHPAFRIAIAEGGATRRVRQEARVPITQRSHLKFPHGVHLDAKGVKSPTKGRVRLECGGCHVPDASRRMFEPISMAKQCQECHRLEIEPAVTARQAPHGKPADAVAMIEEFYATLALKGVPDSFQKAFGVPGEGLLRRAGATEVERQDALRLATRKAQQVATDLFEVRVCKTCHEVTRESPADASAPSWKIAPVRAASRWMPAARFDHRSHAQTKCADCHDVARSKSGDDVAMPGIESGRECHGGSQPRSGKVTSTCLLCHDFHSSSHPWDPAFKPRAPERRAAKEAR